MESAKSAQNALNFVKNPDSAIIPPDLGTRDGNAFRHFLWRELPVNTRSPSLL